MMRWLRTFFYSDDPVVRVAAAISEAEAQLLRDVLQDSEIPAFTKNMSFLTITHGAGSIGNDYDLFVKQSDLERAREVLAPLVEPQDQEEEV